MSKRIIYFFSFILIILLQSGYSQSVEEIDYTIVKTFPTPGPSPQGLASDSTYIWLADDSTDIIYKINPIDGTVISYFDSPGPEPKGLTYEGANIWNLDDSLRKIFKLDQESGIVLDSIDFPDTVDGLSVTGFPFSGLAWDGDYFWTSFFAGWSSSVIRISQEDGTVDSSFYCDAEDLSFDCNHLWSVDSQDGYSKGFVKKWEIPSGKEIAYFKTPGYFPTSLTFDNSFLWLTDSEKDSLYKINIIPTRIEGFSNESYNSGSFILHQNYPNPFNSSTIIQYRLKKFSGVILKVVNIQGEKIIELVNDIQPPGVYKVNFKGNNLSSGIYFYILKTDNSKKIKAMQLIK